MLAQLLRMRFMCEGRLVTYRFEGSGIQITDCHTELVNVLSNTLIAVKVALSKEPFPTNVYKISNRNKRQRYIPVINRTVHV